jgi:hypothetical protein
MHLLYLTYKMLYIIVGYLTCAHSILHKPIVGHIKYSDHFIPTKDKFIVKVLSIKYVLFSHCDKMK